MKKKYTAGLEHLACAAVALAGCAVADSTDASEASPSSDHTTSVELAAALQAGVDTLHRDGVVGVVGQVDDRQGQVPARAGQARLDSADPVAFDSRFRIASETKTFVAVVVLQLVDEGKLRLDDTVDRWLPGVVTGNGNHGEQITIRQLLQHTSGIFNYLNDQRFASTADDYLRTRFQHWSAEQLVAIAMSYPPNFAPGTNWSYSNTNYVLAGMIIKKVTGRTWSAEVQRRIVAPLHLTATFDPGDRPDLPAPHAEGYKQFAEGDPLVDVTLVNVTFGDAAGALISTTEDLTRFWRALQRGQLLSPDRMVDMHATISAPDLAAAIPGARYGLGIWSVPTRCGGLYWTHFGDTSGFATYTAVDDDGARVVAVFENTTYNVEAPAVLLITDSLKLLDDVMCAGR